MTHSLPLPTTRWSPPRIKYQLAASESLNGPSTIDLMIQWRRVPVVDALLELATAAQASVARDPENGELQKFSYSLSWHYHCLQKCKKLDSLIRTAAAKQERLDELKAVAASVPSRFDAVWKKLDGLTKYVKPQPGRVPPVMWVEPPRDELMRGGLGPATVADLPRMAPELSPIELLEGFTQLLGIAPWVQKGQAFHYEYFADPGQRLEFLAACGELLPEVEALKRSVQRLQGLGKAQGDATAARIKVQIAWAEARGSELLPPTLGSLLNEVIERQQKSESLRSALAPT